MDITQFSEKYRQVFHDNHLDDYTSTETIEKMYKMVENLLKVNAAMNLTAITDWDDIIVKHLADSCTVLPYLPQNSKVCDVGCGGGFPSLPMAIARPDLKVVGLDSTGKKVDYINASAALLGLSNLSAICGRAEDFASGELRESFDVVTARAVAPLNILCELCLPLLKVDGIFCAMKGRQGDEELAQAQGAYSKLGAAISPTDVHRFEIYGDARMILAVRKTKATPASYPRAYAQIKKKPLS